MGNNSPHVNAVEFGEYSGTIGRAYPVYQTLRANIKNLVAEAIRQAGLK
jgi:hypothetical protein